MKKTSLLRYLISLILMLTFASVSTAESLLPKGSEAKTLANGMRVIVVPTDTPQVVALQIVMSVGSRNEVEPGKSGFAHFFEHLMFRGTERYPNEVAQAMLKKAGVDSNAWTWDDQTVYHKVFLKEDLDKILDYEADRFQNLKFAEPEFRTEALAVLGEYNKNSSDPTEKMFELMQDTAFDKHTYEHTTMGFLRDIKQYPEGYDYAWKFFDRFYRPEYATVLLVGDVEPKTSFEQVAKHFGPWKRGTYTSSIETEPAQTQPREKHIDWESSTLPWLTVGYKAPPFSDMQATASMQLWEALAFSKTGDLYKKLVLEEKIVDEFRPFFWLKRDPFLVGISVRVTDPERFDEVKAAVLEAFESTPEWDLDPQKLEDVKSRTRYSFLKSLDSPKSIAGGLAFLFSLDNDLGSIDRYYDAISKVTASQLKSTAQEYFKPEGRTVITLSQKESKK